MSTATIIEEIRKLPPDRKRVIRDFVLSDDSESEQSKDQPSLREVQSQSPLADLDFELPERVRSPIRPVEL